MAYPDWVLRHKTKGTNISCIKGNYYLYSVTSKWDKEKGRSQKITTGYLGRITQEGIIPSKRPSMAKKPSVTVKEYGASRFLADVGKDILEKLRSVFPEYAEMLFTIAAVRVMERCPFRRMELHYEHSYLSELFAGLNLSKNRLTDFLRTIGKDREKIAFFMEQFVHGNGHILFDATNILSKSDKMNINRNGYNSKKEYDPQVNLLYAFSREDKTPVYYRVVPGNIRDVTALKLSVEESGLRDMIVVADKGFGSQANLDMMDEASLQYIIPLKRNSQWFDKSILEQGDKGKFDGYFLWQKRVIWHYSKTLDNGKRVIVFLDEELRNSEQKTYLNNIERDLEGYTHQVFLEKQYVFGTIVMITNTEKTSEDVYASYKERGEIEQSFDFLKNLLDQDKSYMQNEKSLEAWAFINHISLLLNYKIYNLLRESMKIKKYSIDELISHLKYISKAKINGKWLTTEISRKTSDLMVDLKIHIT